MRICSSKNNITISWAALDVSISNLYYRNDKNMPDGVYFRLIMENSFFTTYEEIIKYCKFIFVNSVGIYHKENDSYSGGYGLVQQSKVDSFLRVVDYNLKEKFYFSNCVSSINNFATQTINREIYSIDSLAYLFNFLIPSIEFSSILIGSLILYFSFLILITKFKLISKFIHKLLSLFFIIFLFFIINLYNSSLNTSNVIVDTDDLLNDIDDILKTKRELCVYEKSSADNDFFFNAPKYSLASQINKKINHNNLCYLSNSETNGIGNFLERDQSRIFIFTYDIGRYYAVKYIQTFFKKDLFISSKPIYENLRSIIISKKSSKQLRDLIDNWLYRALENGINLLHKSIIPNYSGMNLAKFGEFTHYDNLKSYVDAYTITKSISFEKLDSLFKIYFALLILLILIFLIHHLINYFTNYFTNYFKKSFKKFKNYLILYL